MLRSLVLRSVCLNVLFIAVMVYLSFKIRKPLLTTAEYIDQIANGNLSGNLEVKSVIREVTTLIRMKVSGEGHVLAMGPYLSAGVAVAVLWGNEFLQWYLALYH